MSLNYSLTYSEYLYAKQLLAVRSFFRTTLLRVVLVQGIGCHDRSF
jgi:hypothetical protein